MAVEYRRLRCDGQRANHTRRSLRQRWGLRRPRRRDRGQVFVEGFARTPGQRHKGKQQAKGLSASDILAVFAVGGHGVTFRYSGAWPV
jgi:hypothetical protein